MLKTHQKPPSSSAGRLLVGELQESRPEKGERWAWAKTESMCPTETEGMQAQTAGVFSNINKNIHKN